MHQLNPRQTEAVHYIDGPCLVLAGAGSGKTSVITEKIAYLIKDCGIPARNIFAVTFTNKAAREMKGRAGKLLANKEKRGLSVSTFHNLGLRIIRSELKLLGLKAGFSIFDGQDAKLIIKELMLRSGEDAEDEIGEVQNQISQWKNEMLPPASAVSHSRERRDCAAMWTATKEVEQAV